MPGIAIANELNKMGISTIFIGSKYGMEKKILTSWKLYLLPIKGFVRTGIGNQILIPFQLIYSVFLSISILKKLGVKCIISTGGYASIPSVISAKLLSIPVFLLEVNAVPGFAAKLTSLLAMEVFIGFPITGKYLNGKITYTGTPVRNIISNISRENAVKYFGLETGRKTILIFGGSGGAKSILNLTKSLIEILPRDLNIQFIIQKGRYKIDLPKKFPCIIRDYIEDMDIAYKAADIIISRAGASSVKEIYLTGKPAIFIPYPYAYKDHQYLNAKSVEKENLRIVLREKELTPEILFRYLDTLMNSKGKERTDTSAKDIARRVGRLCLER